MSENDLELAVEEAWKALGNPANRALVPEIRRRLVRSFDSKELPLPGQWAEALVKIIGAEALDDLLLAHSQPKLIDGAMVGALLTTLVERNAEEVRPVLARHAETDGPLQLCAVMELSYLAPDRDDGLQAMLVALRSSSDAIRAEAAVFVLGSDWCELPELANELRRLEQADPSAKVRDAIRRARP